MENISTLEKVLPVCNGNAELLRLVGGHFWFQSGLSQKNKEEKFEKFAEKKFAIFCFICLLLLLFVELSNINWKCSENCNMLTERTYDRAVFEIFAQYYNNLHFYCAIINPFRTRVYYAH